MKTNIISRVIGGVRFTIKSNDFDGELLDTEVQVSEGMLVVVAGCDRNDFLTRLEELVDEYRI